MWLKIIKLGCLLGIFIKDIKGDINILEYFQQPGEHLNLSRKTTAHRINEMGYPCEQHEVHTADGYIVSLFRIPFSPKDPSSSRHGIRPKVLLQHGLFGTSDMWVLNGPDYSLSFLLADQGYDVWLGNARGTLYGRKHANLSMTDEEFWRFSWHEIGYYDLAAMIDYALQYEIGAKSLHYIGHSQGTTVALVLLSLRPEYHNKLRTVQLLAPVVRLDHSQDPLLKILSPYLGYHNFLSQRVSRQEFVPFNELFNVLAYGVCQQDSMFQQFCSPMAFMVEGSFEHKNTTALFLCLESHPGGISTEQLLHFMQVHYSSSFRQYDFGYVENLQRYNQPEPPQYPVENITKLLHAWYGDGDQTSSAIDVLTWADHMPNIQLHRIADDLWSHGDFFFSLNVRRYVYEPIMEIIGEYERNKMN